MRPGGRALVASVWALAAACVVTTSLLMGPVRALDPPGLGGSVQPTEIVEPLLALALVTLGALVVLRGVSRRYGWLMLAGGCIVASSAWSAPPGSTACTRGTGSQRPTYPSPRRLAGCRTCGWAGSCSGSCCCRHCSRMVGPWRWPVSLASAAWLVLIVGFILADRPLTAASSRGGGPRTASCATDSCGCCTPSALQRRWWPSTSPTRSWWRRRASTSGWSGRWPPSTPSHGWAWSSPSGSVCCGTDSTRSIWSSTARWCTAS